MSGEGKDQSMVMLNTESKANVLLVDDDPALRRVFTHMLSRSGYDVVSAEGAEEAIKEAWTRRFDLVLTDIHMPGMTGDLLVSHLRDIQPEILSVIMTAKPSMDLAIDAVNQGVQQFLTKPIQLEDLQGCIETVLESRSDNVRRIQNDFAASLLEKQRDLGVEFDLQQAVGSALGLDQVARGERPFSASLAGTHVILLCEPIPEDTASLRKSKRYRHFRTLYLAQKIFNDQLKRDNLETQVRLVMVNSPAEYGTAIQQYGDQVRCVVFGPNFRTLTDSIVRLAPSAHEGRLVVVCHNPGTSNFSWERLSQFGRELGVEAYRATADEGQVVSFWADFFTNRLKPTVNSATNASGADGSSGSPEEIGKRLSRDTATLEMLPAYPQVCRQVLRIMDEGARFEAIGEAVQLDGALHASLIHTANLARYGNLQRVERISTALSVIGVQETKKIILGRAMGELVKKVQHSGFDNRGFFLHGSGTAYLAQFLSLNLQSPSHEEQGTLHGMRLSPYVTSVLSQFRLWEKFELQPGFDPFSGGILHDIGKVVNTVCYPDVFPLILNEIERTQWKRNLVECEQAVVGELHHAATGAALLKRWEIDEDLVQPIGDHHLIDGDSAPETVLLSLANCLVKGTYPFPRRIDLSDDLRRESLGVRADAGRGRLDNPLISAYTLLKLKFTQAIAKLAVSAEEEESGIYAPDTVQRIIETAKAVARDDTKAYVGALIEQNHEFLDVAEWMKVPTGDLIALGLLLDDTVIELVEQFFHGTTSTSYLIKQAVAA